MPHLPSRQRGNDPPRLCTDEVDAIAAYCPAVEGCYLIPFAWVGDRKVVQLRTRMARNNQRAGVTMASEFEMESLHLTSYFAGP